MIYKKIEDLSATQLYELQDCIEALYEMLPLNVGDCDVCWFYNRLRHILECILTDEAFDRLFLGITSFRVVDGRKKDE